jgi:hypothetical protein
MAVPVTVRECVNCGGVFECDTPGGGSRTCSQVCRDEVKRYTRNASAWATRNGREPAGVCGVCRVTVLSTYNTGRVCRPCWDNMNRGQRDMWESRLGREGARA